MPNPKRDIIVSNIPIGTEDRTFVVFPSLHHEEDVAHGMSLPTQNQEPYVFFYFFVGEGPLLICDNARLYRYYIVVILTIFSGALLFQVL